VVRGRVAARRAFAVAGTQTAGLLISGYTTGYVTNVEEYDGTSWSGVTGIPTSFTNGGAAGIQTSAIQMAGSGPGTTSFEYDGTNWTAGGALGTARNSGGCSGTTQDLALAISGEIPPGASKTVNVEEYNGTSWSEINNVATGRNPSGNSPGGSSSAAFFSGGQGATQLTEEYNFTANTITPGAWASGGTVPYTSRQNMSFGTQDAAINVGGYVTATLSTAASYDGASWTASPSLNVAARMGGVAGTQTAGLQFGGIQPPGTYNAIICKLGMEVHGLIVHTI
jgi:hypothetical protein